MSKKVVNVSPKVREEVQYLKAISHRGAKTIAKQLDIPVSVVRSIKN